MRALSYIGAEKITFPPKPDIQTDIHTDRHTYIQTDGWTDSIYRVASLLKIKKLIDIPYQHFLVIEHLSLTNKQKSISTKFTYPSINITRE